MSDAAIIGICIGANVGAVVGISSAALAAAWFWLVIGVGPRAANPD